MTELTLTLEAGEAAEAAQDICATESQGPPPPGHDSDGLLHEPYKHRG